MEHYYHAHDDTSGHISPETLLLTESSSGSSRIQISFTSFRTVACIFKCLFTIEAD